MLSIESPETMESIMTLDTARALLQLGHLKAHTSLTDNGQAERDAFNKRMARMRANQYAWAPLSGIIGAIAQRRGRWE
jgi:hypothetical protein